MNIKMIVTDLDGTLLHNDETLSDESIDVIKRFQNKGIRFVIATSRSLSSAMKFAKLLNPDAIIASGGAQVLIGNNLVYEAAFAPTRALDYIKQCLNESVVDFIRVIGEKVDWTTNNNISVGELEFGHYKRIESKNYPEQKVYKITICSKDIKKVQKMFEHENDCHVTISYAGKYFHKLTHIKATKEDALLKVANHFGITYKNIVSFGDDISDIMMLKRCEKGIAVNNALSCVKDIANDICIENENDGVVKYLMKNFSSLLEGDSRYANRL